MDYKVKKNYENHNDISGICYRMSVPAEDVPLARDEKYNYEYVSRLTIKDWCTPIRQFIDCMSDIKIIDESGWIKHYNGKTVDFEVFCKKQSLINAEQDIRRLLKDNGFKVEGYSRIDIDSETESKIKIDIPMYYTEDNINKIKELIHADTWTVIFDGHMENMYLIYYWED